MVYIRYCIICMKYFVLLSVIIKHNKTCTFDFSLLKAYNLFWKINKGVKMLYHLDLRCFILLFFFICRHDMLACKNKKKCYKKPLNFYFFQF